MNRSLSHVKWNHRIFIGILLLAVLTCVTWMFAKGFAEKFIGGLSTVETNFELRMASPSNEPITTYDPASIHDSGQSNILRAIYSTLLYFDREGQIQPGAAESYSINGTKIRFQMRRGLRTIDGHAITARDVEGSFKRQIILSSNTHGDLDSFICIHERPKSLTDPCREITVFDDQTIEFNLRSANIVPFFIRLVVNPDFSVIPLGSLDTSQPRMPIVDYRNTSGVYFVETPDKGGAHVLALNSNHFLAHSKLPRKIHFVQSLGDRSVRNIREGKIDLIPTFDLVTYSEAKSLLSDPTMRFHETAPIKASFIQFTKTGMKNLDRNQRHYVGMRLKELYLKSFGQDEALEPTSQFFGIMSEGRLDPDQAAKFETRLSSIKEVPLPKRIVGEIYTQHMSHTQPALTPFKEVVLQWPGELVAEPDFIINITDTAFYESVALLSYMASMGSTSMSREQARDWINSYMETTDKAQRLRKVREFHFEMLDEAYIVPIGFTSYTTVIRAPWTAITHRLYAGTPLWMISRD